MEILYTLIFIKYFEDDCDITIVTNLDEVEADKKITEMLLIGVRCYKIFEQKDNKLTEIENLDEWLVRSDKEVQKIIKRRERAYRRTHKEILKQKELAEFERLKEKYGKN